ncbi:hypothetical protein KKC59_01665 [bacterium]|nr:hypothetical protein [bacterium]
MKRICSVFTATLVLVSLVYAGSTFAASAYDDLSGTYQDTTYFDGGPGSALNTSCEGYGSGE